MTVDTMARLYELKNIAGVKDATGDLNRVNQTLDKMGKEFIQLTGNDDNALEFNRRGGVGTISVTANIAPKLCSDFQKFSKSESENEIKEAEKLNKILQPHLGFALLRLVRLLSILFFRDFLFLEFQPLCTGFP
mgnify:CR=1 FL=1